MSKPKNILVILSSQLYDRNYIKSGALTALSENHNLRFMIPDNIEFDYDHMTKLGSYTRYHVNDNRSAKFDTAHRVMAIRYGHKSRSFKFRLRRQYPTLDDIMDGHKRQASWTYDKARRAYRLLKFLRSQTKLIGLHFLANTLVFSIYKRFFVDKLTIEPEFAKGVMEPLPDLVILPSSAYGFVDIDIAKFCNRNEIKTLYLIDNWDNLSSKSIIWEKPTYIATWGKQSVQHAVDIQGFDRTKVFSIGTPRFDHYFKTRQQSLPSYFDFKYVLFVGTAVAFNEAKALQVLSDEIDQNQQLYGDLKIVYRPHPWRQGLDSIANLSLPYVIIDPQVRENYMQMSHGTDFQPSLDYYPALLQNAHFVIGGISSMAIEATIFWQRYIALAYDEAHNQTSPQNMLDNYVHFDGLKELPNIVFCRSFEAMPLMFRQSFKEPASIDHALVDSRRQFFLFSDDLGYAHRLSNLVSHLFNEHSQS